MVGGPKDNANTRILEICMVSGIPLSCDLRNRMQDPYVHVFGDPYVALGSLRLILSMGGSQKMLATTEWIGAPSKGDAPKPQHPQQAPNSSNSPQWGPKCLQGLLNRSFLSIYLSMYLFIRLFTYVYIYVYIYKLRLYIYMYTHICIVYIDTLELSRLSRRLRPRPEDPAQGGCGAQVHGCHSAPIKHEGLPLNGT